MSAVDNAAETRLRMRPLKRVASWKFSCPSLFKSVTVKPTGKVSSTKDSIAPAGGETVSETTKNPPDFVILRTARLVSSGVTVRLAAALVATPALLDTRTAYAPASPDRTLGNTNDAFVAPARSLLSLRH